MKDKRPIYFLVISCLLLAGVLSWSDAADTGQPIAVLPESGYEFSPVPEGTQILRDVKIQNKGTAPLNIENVRTGWGCTAVSFPKQIPAGGEGIIKIKGDTTGYAARKFKKQIKIHTNDPRRRELTFTVSGDVELVYAINPRHVKIQAPVGETQPVTLIIVPEEKYPFRILSAQAEKGEYIKYDLKDTKRGDRDAFQLTVENTKTSEGRFFDTIELKTDSEIQPKISVWVFVDIKNKYRKKK